MSCEREEKKEGLKALTTRGQLLPPGGCRERPRVQTKASSSSPRQRKKLLPCNSERAEKNKEEEKKASPDVEAEEGGREGRAGPLVPLRGHSHRIKGTVAAIELGEGLFENRRQSWLITLMERGGAR